MQFTRLSPGRAPACEGSGKSTLLRLIAGLHLFLLVPTPAGI